MLFFKLIIPEYSFSNTLIYSYSTPFHGNHSAVHPNVVLGGPYTMIPGPGDIVFTAFQSSFPDGIEFITLRRLDLRNVTITDNGILSTNAMRTGEGSYTFPNISLLSDVPAGTIVRLDEANGVNDLDPSDGVIHIFGNGTSVAAIPNFNLSQLGDQVIAYSGISSSPTFIAGIAGADIASFWNSGATNAINSKTPGTISDIYYSSTNNAFFNGSILNNGNGIRANALNTSNWNVSATAQVARFDKKNIQFIEPVYSSGSVLVSNISSSSFTIDISGLSFLNESAEETRYAIVINSSTTPSIPSDRYTCYSGNLLDLTADFLSDPVIKQSASDVCTGINGMGKLVYLGFDKTTSLVVQGLVANTNYYISVFAVNGNGWSSNFSSSPAFTTQATPTGLATVITNVPHSQSTNSAIVSGSVTFEGGASVFEKGIVWDQITDPEFPGLGNGSDGFGLGGFSLLIYGLDPQTQYHSRAYAINSNGISYGNNQSFYTFSNPPSHQASDLDAYPQSTSQINISWEPATFPSTGATVKGYVLLRALSPQVPTLFSSNGQAPVAGNGTIVSSSIDGSLTTYINNGLLASTTYNFLLVPFCWDGIHPETFNYLTVNAANGWATTFNNGCIEPTLSVSSVNISGVNATGITLNWTAGNGDRSLVVVRAESPTASIPTNGSSYISSSNFGIGTAINPAEFIVFNGGGNSVTITNLSPSTTYYYTIYTFNSAGYCYLISTSTSGFATTLSSPEIIETFEPGAKAVYTSGNVVCNLGVWNFVDALIGTTPGSDRFNGTRAARIINNGIITMQFDKPNGLDSIKIFHSTFGSDATSTWAMEISTNGGATFDAFVSPVFTSNNTSSLSPVIITVQLTGNIRVRIRKLSGGANRMNIDDISFSDFLSDNTVQTGAIIPSSICITSGQDYALDIPFTTTGFFGVENIFTAQLSDAYGNFDSPVEIGSLASTAGNLIGSFIPNDTEDGANYSVRIKSSHPEVIGIPNVLPVVVFNDVPEVSNLHAQILSGSSIALNWTLPTGCFDELLIVARQSGAVSAIPSGDGSQYAVNSVFSTGGSGVNLPLGEFGLYRNPGGAEVTITGLTPNITYYLKVFIRKGNQWSAGVVLMMSPFNPQIGDFQTQSSGSYTNPLIWLTYDGASWVQSDIYPNQYSFNTGTDNVTIKSGHDVILDASCPSNSLKNLIVESGSRLWSQDSTYNGNRYLSIYGNIQCNGSIGRGVNLYDNISFNIEGNPTCISGSGIFNAGRIRKNYMINPTSELLMLMNIGLKFASGPDISSGAALYNNASGESTFNLTVNENCSLNIFTKLGSSANVSIDGTDGEGSNEQHGKFTINGTLNIPGTLFAFTNNSIRSIAYEIGNSGVINCFNVCSGNSGSANSSVHNGSAQGGCTLRVLSGGKLNLTGGSVRQTNTLNKPFGIRSNEDLPFAFVSGIGTTNNTFDFQSGSTVEYSGMSGTMPVQSVGLSYANLRISGNATKTVNSLLDVREDLEIKNPSILDPSGNSIRIGGSWRNYHSEGFLEGTIGSVEFNGSNQQSILCSGEETFHNLTVSNNNEQLILNTNLRISGVLNLSIAGKLNFGDSPKIVSLTNMNSGATCLVGGNLSEINLSSSSHRLTIGSESHNYVGTLISGNSSIVNYNRSSALSGSSGNQQIITGVTYANLCLTGSGSKSTNEDFTVTGDLIIDGIGTEISALNQGKSLGFGGDIKLEAGAMMNPNCRENLSISSIFSDKTQTLTGNGNILRCFNFTAEKTGNGSVSLTANSSLHIKNDLRLKEESTGIFSDGGNSIQVGDDVFISGDTSNYLLTGSLLFTGENDTFNTLGNEAFGICGAHVNNLIVQSSLLTGETQILPSSGGSTIRIKGNLTIQNGIPGFPGVLNPSSNRIELGGNWSNYNQSGFFDNNSEICLCGFNSNQSITTTGGELFNHLEINNAQNVLFQSDVQVRSNLFMHQGNIDAGFRLLTLGESTSIPGILTYQSGRIIGKMSRWFGNSSNSGIETGLFPIGNFLFEQFVQVEYASAPTSGGTLTASFVQDDMANWGVPLVNYAIPSAGGCQPFSVSRLSDQGYWQIDAENGLNGGLYDITLDAEGFEIVNDPCELTALKREGSGIWQESGIHQQTVGTATRPKVKRIGASGWSNWGLGAGGFNPLPIELISFTADQHAEHVILEWTTASEINNEKFVIERSSNAIQFEPLKIVNAAGNSTSLINYATIDANPLEGISYYRLKQIDYNGDSSFSHIVSVNFKSTEIWEIISCHFESGLLNLSFTSPAENVTIELYDISGKRILVYPKMHSEKSIALEMIEIPNSFYLLIANNGTSWHCRKIIR